MWSTCPGQRSTALSCLWRMARSRSCRPRPSGSVDLPPRSHAPCSERPARAHLIDRREPGVKAVARRAKVQPPDARAFGTGQRLCLLDVLIQALDPVAEGDGVVLP